MAHSAPPAWLHHLKDEADAAFLYRELALAEPDPARGEIYRALADVEDRHVVKRGFGGNAPSFAADADRIAGAKLHL